MDRGTKERRVEGLKRSFGIAQAVVFVDYTGLTVAEADAFRIKVRAAKLVYEVAKNTLIEQALPDDGRDFRGVPKLLKGSPTGVLFGFEDPVQTARAAFDYAKECAHFRVKGALAENTELNASQAASLSKMPNRREMQGQLLQTILSAGARVAGQVQSPARRIAGAIKTLAERTGEGAQQE